MILARLVYEFLTSIRPLLGRPPRRAWHHLEKHSSYYASAQYIENLFAVLQKCTEKMRLSVSQVSGGIKNLRKVEPNPNNGMQLFRSPKRFFR